MYIPVGESGVAGQTGHHAVRPAAGASGPGTECAWGRGVKDQKGMKKPVKLHPANVSSLYCLVHLCCKWPNIRTIK